MVVVNSTEKDEVNFASHSDRPTFPQPTNVAQGGAVGVFVCLHTQQCSNCHVKIYNLFRFSDNYRKHEHTSNALYLRPALNGLPSR